MTGVLSSQGDRPRGRRPPDCIRPGRESPARKAHATRSLTGVHGSKEASRRLQGRLRHDGGQSHGHNVQAIGLLDSDGDG